MLNQRSKQMKFSFGNKSAKYLFPSEGYKELTWRDIAVITVRSSEVKSMYKMKYW